MAKRSAAARACQFMQLYARLLETDANGYGYCCSCGALLSWDQGQGGHFHPKGRNYNAAAFEEENIHLQCSGCNTNGGNVSGYAQFMDREYGQWDEKKNKFINPVVDYINSLIHVYLDIEDVRDIARIYKDKCKELAKNKNFPVSIPT